MAAKLKSQISSAFKMHGLSLRSEANRYLVEVLLPINEVEREDWLDRIIDIVQKQPLTTSMVQKDVCESAVQECNQEQDSESENVLNIIDTFSTPRFTYMQERKKFIPNATLGLDAPALHGSAADKASVFLDRYTILHQRTLRHDLFTPPMLGALPGEGTQKFQLKPLEYLKGTTATVKDIIVLGMLTQLKEGKWYLEDPTGSVLLDLSNTSFHVGLFAESCFVLAEGWYEDGIFHVDALGFPPSEPAKTTRAYFGNMNMFGGPSQVCVQSSVRLQQALQESTGAMMVFIADLWLDSAKVLEKLRQLFSGFADCPPTAFVLCGHFLSCPAGQGHLKALKEGFKALGELIAEFPTLTASSKFIFIPGPEDAGHPTILPRPAIPHCLTEGVRGKVPSAVFTSNPCRLTYCSREMVVMRHDIVTKMCRHCLRFPQDGDVPTHFAKTVVAQGHMCPLPLAVCPVYWAYDCGLRLYPLPDLLVCADRFQPFTRSATDCTVLNPGSFPRTDFSFKVYYPASGEVQDSKIP